MIQKLQNAHPAVNLKTAYDRLQIASKKIKGDISFSRETLVKAMGFLGKKSGTAHNVAGSLVHFGLLRKVERGYTIPRQTRKLLSEPIHSEEWVAKMKAVAINPEMYNYIYEKYKANLPPELKTQLISKFGDRNVNDKNVENIIRSYLESLEFAGYEVAAKKTSPSSRSLLQSSSQKQAIELDGQAVYVYDKYLFEAYHKTLQDDLELIKTKLQSF